VVFFQFYAKYPFQEVLSFHLDIVEFLISNYQKILSDFETNKGVVQSQKRKISEIDLSSNLNNLNPSDNKISVNIDGRIYSVKFDEVNKNEAMKELSYKISQTTGFSSTFKDGVLKIEQSEAMGKEFKVNSIDVNKNVITPISSNDYEIYNNENPTPSVQNSIIDYTSKLSSLNPTDNKLSINIQNETYSVSFDKKVYDSSLKGNEEKKAIKDMKELYNFLSQKGKDKFGLKEPLTIPTEERSEQFEKYSTADTIVSALKDLSDEISNNVGFSSTVVDGVLDVKGL
jgi:hypothetical protein